MARRNWDGSTAPSPPCSSSKAGAVLRAIRAMRDKQINMAKQPFTLPELMDLFVRPEHREHLLYSYALVEPSGMTSTLYVKADVRPNLEQHINNVASKDCYMRFSWYGKQDGGFHVPEREGSEEKYAMLPLRDTCDPALIERYTQVEQDLLDIQCRFALCEKVFRNLNNPDNCRTLPQMRYVWPAIVILLNKGGFKEDAKMLAEPSARAGDKVNLEPHLSALLKETNDTIVRAMMLDDVADPGDDALPIAYYLSDTFDIS